MTGPSGSQPAPGSLDERLGPVPGFTLPSHDRRWYRRWITWAAVVVVAVVAVVLADFPTHQNVSQRASDIAGVVQEISTDVHPCAFAVNEAFRTFYEPARNGTLSQTSRAFSHQYLDEDQQACSFENTAIFSMSTITVPNTPAGERMGELIKTVLEWATSDANGAILDIQTLLARPSDAKALHDLAVRERRLAADRASAERTLRRAESELGGQALPGLGLPRLPVAAS